VVDHIEPASHNEADALNIANLAGVHKRCNERKGNRSADTIIAERPSRDW
jgi:5-methylcytosine-specific restriction endonuclease McrA